MKRSTIDKLYSEKIVPEIVVPAVKDIMDLSKSSKAGYLDYVQELSIVACKILKLVQEETEKPSVGYK